MRWQPVLVAALALGAAAAPAHAGPASNPAFLGIVLQDARPFYGTDGCLVVAVTEGSGAESAGIRMNDIVLGIDGTTTITCTQLTGQIVTHPPGDTVKLDIRRGSEKITARATLSTRAEILQRRFVGRALDPVEVVDVDDGHAFDLGSVHGQTTVIGWYDLRKCGDCATVFRKVADAAATAKQPIKLLALTYGTLEERDPQRRKVELDMLASYRATSNLSVPLAVADEELFRRASIVEGDRVHFMVVDGRGVVRFVTPIAPDGDDVDAAIDEVLAAAEQADHARPARR